MKGIDNVEKVKENPLEIYEFVDVDGDKCIGIDVEDFIVFAVNIGDKWALNFSLKESYKNKHDWADELTGRGAFPTINKLKPAFTKIINYLEKKGGNWFIYADPRRAKLYKRYVPDSKIILTEPEK